MNKKTSDILTIAISNILIIILSMFIGTLLPMALNKDGYADYGIFKFFTSYITIFHLGFINGYFLKYGDKSLEEMRKGNIPIILRYYCYLQMIIFVILFSLCYILDLNPIYKLVVVWFIFHNLNSLYIKMYNGTMLFKLSSVKNIVSTILQLALIYYFYKNNFDNPLLFMWLNIGLEIIRLLYGTFIFRSVMFTKGEKEGKELRTFGSVLLLGLPMMIAVYVANFAMGLDKIFIQAWYTKDEYANYTFAYEFIMMVYTLIVVANDVIIPYLLRYKGENLKAVFLTFTKIINVMYVFSILFIIFPALYVQRVNTQYLDALSTYYILYVVILFKLQINAKFIPFYTYFKKGEVRLVIASISLVIAALSNFIVHLFFKDYTLFAVATIITFFIWNFLSDCYFSYKLKTTVLSSNLFQIFIIIGMLVVAYTSHDVLTSYGILAGLVITSIIIYHKTIYNIYRSIKYKKNFFFQ